MITIYFHWKGKEESKVFTNRIKALRFLYSIKSKGYFISGWSCEYPDDNDYLNRKFKR